MAAPTAVLLARLAGLLESARLDIGHGDTLGADLHIIKAAELVAMIQDGV